MALNILIVDDSAVIRMMILKTLKCAGLDIGEAHQAADGQQGLAVLDEHWVDIAFIDINMPVMNGEEMIDRIRANSALADLPILVISTEGSETRIQNLLKKGARFVHKPFTPEKIRDVVNEMLGIGANDGQ